MTRLVSDAIAIGGGRHEGDGIAPSVGSFTDVQYSLVENFHHHTPPVEVPMPRPNTQGTVAARNFPLLTGEEIEKDNEIVLGDCRVVQTNFRFRNKNGLIFGHCPPLTGHETALMWELLPDKRCLTIDQCIPLVAKNFVHTASGMLPVCLQREDSISIIPLVDLEAVEYKDLKELILICKDGRVYRLPVASCPDKAVEWYKKLCACTIRMKYEDSFAYSFADAVSKCCPSWLGPEEPTKDYCQAEWDRLNYDPAHFRIYEGNKNYEQIGTYPERFVVPAGWSDEEISRGKYFRFLQRVPTVIWKSHKNSVLMRSSQPKQGLFGWRNPDDEKIFECITEYMKTKVPGLEGQKPLVILDARSYAAAFANRGKGGGYENAEYYSNSDTTFLGLPNIHTVRYAFVQLRNVLTSPIDQATYMQSVQNTQWLHHLSSLLLSSSQCVDYLLDGSSVLVHCSDGWDRTTQIVAFAKLMADDYYRTIEGFEHLIQREWIDFGHKFGDRLGSLGVDQNERAPVFIQWLEGVWHLHNSNPTAFQFNKRYLVSMAQHAYSGLFSTFMFNSNAEAANYPKNLVSIFRFLRLSNEEFVNQHYDSSLCKNRLNVRVGVQNLSVWREVYCPDIPEGDIPAGSGVDQQIRTTAASPPAKLQRSRSSESLNSTHDSIAGTLNSQHSESNGAICGSGLEPLSITGVMDVSMMQDAPRRDSRPRSASVRQGVSCAEQLGDDGLLRFVDHIQEVALRKKKEAQERVDKLHKENISRNRSVSEKTNHSLGSYNGRWDELSERISLEQDRASDVSFIDSTEAPPTASGWEMDQKQCKRCERVFPRIGLNAEDRPHHCRNCLMVVCDACSRSRYQGLPVQGRTELLRACDVCYSKMNPPEKEDALNSGDELDGDKTPEEMKRHGSMSNGIGQSPVSSLNGFHTHSSQSTPVKG